MTALSVVLIAKNEAHIIERTLREALRITDDVVVVDSGSTDGTQNIALALGAHVIETSWDGFGPNKNKGVAAARHNWILSIDADEVPDDVLINSLQNADFFKDNIVYNIRFKTFFGQKQIRFGEWGRDAHIRLFNRLHVQWNNAHVHEQLTLPAGTSVQTLPGYLLHYTMKDMADYATKMTAYALLNAEQYHAGGKHPTWVKRFLSPPFSFLQNYVFKGGFLDGKEGYLIARMTAYYTFLKYARANELHCAKSRRT